MTFDLKTLPVTDDKAAIEWADILFGAASQAAAAPEPFELAALRDKIDDYIRRAGTKTASDPFAIEQTWNDGGAGTEIFTALKVDATDVSSAPASLLMDLQFGGASKVTVNKSGYIRSLFIGASTAAPLNGWFFQPAFFLGYIQSAGIHEFRVDTYSILNDAAAIKFGASKDTILVRDAANTLALRNGTNAQALRIYNTYIDGSNFEFVGFKWNADTFEITCEAAGTGTQRNIIFDGANRAAKINDPSGGATQDSESRTAINSIIDVLESFGFSAIA